jgi:PTS system nitrogen regulatory IIA component
LLERARHSPESVPPISTLLVAGGIQHDLPGDTPVEVLRAVVERMPLPPSVDRGFLATALAAREAMGSTGVGHGIAIPHVRNPIVLQVQDPLVSLCLLVRPVDFQAIDEQPVHALFTVISPTVSTHLRILAELSYLLQDPGLREQLTQRADAAALFERMRILERTPRRSPRDHASGEPRT